MLQEDIRFVPRLALTVIIPTFNRVAVLGKALDGYQQQTAPEGIRELIVVDDGSTDNTESLVAAVAAHSIFTVRYIRQSNMGPAAARNRGIREAQGEIVLFSDSDIVPGREMVQEHLNWHERNPEAASAVLGCVAWPEGFQATPFMDWYGNNGPLFAYSRLRHEDAVSFEQFYSCNISLKTQFMREHGFFDEEFRAAAFEDIELGYRLSRAGLRLRYNERALAYHYQSFTFAEACRKAKANEAWARLFYSKEAGKTILASQSKRQSRLTYRFAKWVANSIESVVKPASGIVDSKIRLPGIVYHLLYWYNVTRRLGTVLGQ